MTLFSKELQMLDENTVQYMIDDMQDKIDEQKTRQSLNSVSLPFFYSSINSRYTSRLLIPRSAATCFIAAFLSIP